MWSWVQIFPFFPLTQILIVLLPSQPFFSQYIIFLFLVDDANQLPRVRSSSSQHFQKYGDSAELIFGKIFEFEILLNENKGPVNYRPRWKLSRPFFTSIYEKLYKIYPGIIVSARFSIILNVFREKLEQFPKRPYQKRFWMGEE